MKRFRTKTIAILLLFSVLLSGCDMRNYMYTEDSLKRVAEKSLKKKYGEEFVVYRAWDRSQELFFADCSPKDNQDIVFQADIYKNGAGVYADSYAQCVAMQQVDSVLRDSFKETFGDCFARAFMMSYYHEPEFEDVKSTINIKLKDYMSKIDMRTGMDRARYYVFTVQSENSNVNVEKEYELFNWIEGEIQADNLPNMVIHLYFVDSDFLNECTNYFATKAMLGSDLDIDRYPHAIIEYSDGILQETYEEYKSAREEILKNE